MRRRDSRLSRQGRVAAVVAVIVFGSGGVVEVGAQEAADLVWGRSIVFTPLSGIPVSGELLAVDADSIWLLGAGGASGYALAGSSSVRVRQHDMGSRVWKWVGIGALVTGVGMTVSCTRVADECGSVGLAMALSWATVGGLAALGFSASQYEELEPEDDTLRPYARFPQGLPVNFERAPPERER
jgi:hypothetical protein